MASCSGNGSRGHHKFTLNVNETYVSDGASNYSTVSWSLILSPIQTGWDWNYSNNIPVKYNIIINGTYVVSDGAIMKYDGKSTVTINSGIINIPHNADGSKSIDFSFSVWDNVSTSYLPGNASGSGSMTLTKIARYANITQFDLSSGLENITVNWGADSACDSCQYSINNGDWSDSSLSYPSGIITGLYPGTNYNVKIRVKRTDSQLWTESSQKSITTKNIATISSAQNIEFGNSARVIITNPSGVLKNLRLETLNPATTIAVRENVGNDVTMNFTDSEWDTLYKKIKDNNSMTIRYVVDTKGNNTYSHWADRTLTLRGNQKTIKVNINGSWKRGKIWIKKDSSWKRGVMWIKIKGEWRRAI